MALDTTTREGSVALVIDDRTIDERRGDATRTPAERLPAALVAVAEAHQLALADIDLFAVASGPGSFTGLRIGIATVQGLALVTRRPLIGISALEALAQIGSREAAPGELVAAWMDAHRGEVFAAIYRVTGAPLFEPERLASIGPPTVGEPCATLSRWIAERGVAADVFIGDGAGKYADAIASAAHGRLERTPPLAHAIGRLAGARALRGEAINPAAIQPLYIRRPDAELDRERREQARREQGRGAQR